MVYARDEEDPSKRLTRQEIIDNALLLILAGSETAASTLTVTMLALGLNKDVFQKLKQEQADLIASKGEDITRSILDKDCPYLEAVIKETLRIKPIAGTGALRFAQETFTIDGKQIPKGYGVAFK
jgi:cytochrome P450